MKVLWLVSWYPNRLSPFDGDFIKRHAEATSLFADIELLYIVRDKEGVITRDFLVEEKVTGRLKETIIYYYTSKLPFGIDRLFSALKHNRLFKNKIRQIITQVRPSLIHCHVAMKAGLAARWVKRKFSIPYILTEHWTGYLGEAEDTFEKRSPLYKKLCKKIVTDAAAITTVSDVLGKAMQVHFPGIQYAVVPNVVNEEIFYPAKRDTDDHILRMVHISNLTAQKNPELLLEALALFKKQGAQFTIDIFGPAKDDLFIKAGRLALQENVFFRGEVPQMILADALRKSDVLVLYSAYETFGCVIIEANACGVPVIVSDIPVFHELVKEGENGIFAQAGSAEALCAALEKFNQTKQLFQQMDIVSSTTQYNYQNVGRQFHMLYNKILDSRPGQ